MFGRRNPTQATVQSQRGDQDTEAAEEVLDSGIGLDGVAGVGGFGPYDADAPPDDRLARLDLGSLRMPVPEGAQLQIEVESSGPVRAVHLTTELGQITRISGISADDVTIRDRDPSVTAQVAEQQPDVRRHSRVSRRGRH